MLKALLSDVFACLRYRVLLLFLVMLLAGAFEGVGLALLFPLLARFGIGGADQANLAARVVDQMLTWLSIPDDLASLLVFIVFVFYLQTSFTLARAWLEADCQTRYVERWRVRLFNAFIEARWRFFTKERSATRINAIINETGRISATFYLFAQMTTCAIFITIYAAITLATSWQMVVILCLFGGAIYFGLRPLTRRGEKIGGQISETNEALQHYASEFLQNAKLIKSTATEPLAKTLFGNVVANYREIFRRAAFHPNLVHSIYMFFGYAFFGFGIWTTVELLSVNPTTVLVAIYIFLRLYVQLTNLLKFRQNFVIVAPALPTVLAQYREAREAADMLHGGQRLEDGEPATIRFRDVAVHYDQKVALENLSFEIPAGAFVGVTGPSGAGKSTLVDLIVGLVEPASGTVTIDGTPLTDLDVAAWRRTIGYVAQETILLNGSVGKNIAWGMKATNLGTVEVAARMANAHHFIAELAQGYDTEIGERGVRLSGGQRQRLGLARALIGKKRLLILDEATSALDSESELEILKALEKLRGKVTIFMVAHRLSTLKNADHILMLENGRLVESGNWDELIHRAGAFARLRHLQDLSREPSVEMKG